MALVMGILHEDASKKGYHVKPIQTITVARIREMAMYGQLPELRVIGSDSHWYRVRQSGKLRMWKTDAHRIELPVKYGMYTSMTLTSTDFDAGRVGTLESANPRVNPPTHYQAVALLRKVGMSLTKREGEYRVAFSGPGNEHTAYYTNDITDAMQTGLDMARRAGLSGALVRRNPVAGEIPGDVEKIFYQRHGNTKHPGPYQHKFGRGAKMIALKNGDVVIRSVRGKKLWGRY